MSERNARLLFAAASIAFTAFGDTMLIGTVRRSGTPGTARPQ